jgi:hypothetical protein
MMWLIVQLLTEFQRERERELSKIYKIRMNVNTFFIMVCG